LCKRKRKKVRAETTKCTVVGVVFGQDYRFRGDKGWNLRRKIVSLSKMRGVQSGTARKIEKRMRIEEAKPVHAALIGSAVMAAMGVEICEMLCGPEYPRRQLAEMFAELAAREDTQYSYRNTLVATDDDGRAMGAIVCYDGARLEELRRPFLEAMKARFGVTFERLHDETDGGEFYLDSLAVLPEFRHRGVGEALLRAGVERARRAGKPAGLLVDKENVGARRLYEKIGFRAVGERYFCDMMMDHLQMQ